MVTMKKVQKRICIIFKNQSIAYIGRVGIMLEILNVTGF